MTPGLRARASTAPADAVPAAPRRVWLPAGADATSAAAVELHWAPADGAEAAPYLHPWFTEEELAAATLPVVLTLVRGCREWLPHTYVAESVGVPGGLGLYAARPFVGGELVGTMLDGAFLCCARRGSADFLAAVARVPPHRRHFLYTLRLGGRGDCLYDGVGCRLGGPSRANDPKGTGRAANCALYDTGGFNLLPHAEVRPVSARHASQPATVTHQQRRRAELLWHYGPDFTLPA